MLVFVLGGLRFGVYLLVYLLVTLLLWEEWCVLIFVLSDVLIFSCVEFCRSVRLSVCLFVCRCIYPYPHVIHLPNLSANLCIYLCLNFYLSVYLSVYLSAYLSTYMSVCRALFLLSVSNLSIYLSADLSICLCSVATCAHPIGSSWQCDRDECSYPQQQFHRH